MRFQENFRRQLSKTGHTKDVTNKLPSFFFILYIFCFSISSCSKETPPKNNTNTASAKVTENTPEKKYYSPLFLEIKGMHCQGCSDWIAISLMEIKGVKEAKVTHELNLAEIHALPSSKENILNAIKTMRYSVQEIDDPSNLN